MADSFITQCPHCGTSFRVRTEQLAVANGSVRCGACLQVFSARNHVVTTAVPAQMIPKEKTARPPAPKSTQAPKSKLKPAAEKPNRRVEPTIAAASKKPTKPVSKTAPIAKKSPLTPPPKKDSSSFDFDSDLDDDAEFLFSDDDDDFVFKDSPDDRLFDEDDQDEGFGELSDSFLNLSSNSSQKKNHDHFKEDTQAIDRKAFEDDDDDADESWAESILEEIEREDISLAQPAVFDAPEHVYSAPMTHQEKTQALLPDLEDHESDSASSLLKKFNQDIDLEFNAEQRFSRYRPLGWVVVVILIVALAVQLAWLERDRYARMDEWRGFYQQACDIFSCTLPEQVDLDSIRTSVLVREHKDPQLNDLRIVDIVLTNRAPFKQLFPALTLKYSDVNGQLIADQQFIPSDYLKGEMTGVDLMPVNTRIYISVPIKTPPQGAVNYQLTLGSAES